MRKIQIALAIAVILVLSLIGNPRSYLHVTLCHAATKLQHTLFCQKPYNKFREIKYWGAIRIELYDFNLGSNDTNVLNLHDINHNFNGAYWIPKREMRDWFRSEVNKTLIGNIPFHDADQGASERLGEILKQCKGDHKSIYDAMNEYRLEERFRRQKLYGDNPGVIYCRIRVKRNEFPVLFDIKLSIGADNDMKNDEPSLLTVEDMGYSTPENIETEIKKSITAKLKTLSENFWFVRNCPNGK